MDTFAIAATINSNSSVLNFNNAPSSNDKNTFAVLSRMQRIFPKFKRKTEPPNKAVVGDTKKGKEGGRRGPYSESGDRAASVSRRTADDSYCSSLTEAAAQPDST